MYAEVIQNKGVMTMRKSDEFNERLSVEDLVALQKKNAEIYTALKSHCMKKGYIEICRFTKKVTSKESGDNRKVILDNSLDEASNRKLAKLVFRVANSVQTALDMYYLFHLCDSIVDKNLESGE